MYCPYCMQGLILKAKVKADSSTVYICNECDTVWKKYETISDRSGINFDGFAKELSIKPVWDELKILKAAP